MCAGVPLSDGGADVPRPATVRCLPRLVSVVCRFGGFVFVSPKLAWFLLGGADGAAGGDWLEAVGVS